jgi:hypothetical protein
MENKTRAPTEIGRVEAPQVNLVENDPAPKHCPAATVLVVAGVPAQSATFQVSEVTSFPLQVTFALVDPEVEQTPDGAD